MEMVSQAPQLHFVLFPLMAQGHMIPMIDMARLLAQRGVIVSIVTTIYNASRFETILARVIEYGLQIRLVQLQFPCQEAGLPDGCENLDMLPSLGMAPSFFAASSLLQKPVEKLLEDVTPRPSCIISDMCLPWTANIACKFNVPRITFVGISCFCHLCLHILHVHRVLESITSDSDYFIFPGLPDQIEITKAQIPAPLTPTWMEFDDQMRAAEMVSYGVIMNSFEELEPAYVKDYKKAKGDKVWCIGPVSLCNKDELDKARRGNYKASIDEHQCLKWLDSWESRSVIYACLGSLCNLTALQLIELALALEASKRPFIWAIRGGNKYQELVKWNKEDEYEERIKARAILIWDWAPQILILSHPAIGGFLTHCGWNSILESICAGVPMITWPLFGDQFFNEKLVVQILKVGVTVGVETPVKWGEEDKNIGLLVKKKDIERAIEKLMDEVNKNEERRKRVEELGEMAKRAVEEDGSSHLSLTLLIQDIMQQTTFRAST